MVNTMGLELMVNSASDEEKLPSELEKERMAPI